MTDESQRIREIEERLARLEALCRGDEERLKRELHRRRLERQLRTEMRKDVADLQKLLRGTSS